MKRQLYMGGGIMNAVPREQYGLGSIFKGAKKAVKGATKAVKKIAKSDIGKAALLAAAAYYAPGVGIKAQGGLPAFLQGAKTKLTDFALGDVIAGDFPGSTVRGPNLLQRAFGAVTGIGGEKSSGLLTKGLALAGLSTFLTSQYGFTEEQAQEELNDPEKLQSYLRVYYTNLNPNAGSEEIEEFVRLNSATGGRIGFAEGSYDDFKEFMEKRGKAMKEFNKNKLLEEFQKYMKSKDPTVEAAEGGRIGFANGPELPPDPTQPVNPFGPKPIGPVLPDRRMASNVENQEILEALFEKYLDMGLSPKEAADEARKEFEKMSMMTLENRGLAALGGKMDTASDNAMQAAGVEGLPIRQNPRGVKELDLRKTGGFIPPVGIKEKADDIPAMLSNNEFVFTADAVRGAGGGDVNVGAQRMYDTMKRLEAGGRA